MAFWSMPASFISEPILPVEAGFDTVAMARGEPGLPQKFRWRRREFIVAEVLERWKEHGDCQHGSGERYVRKYGYRLRTADGITMSLYFQRSQGRGKLPAKSRWWIHSLEGCAGNVPTAN